MTRALLLLAILAGACGCRGAKKAPPCRGLDRDACEIRSDCASVHIDPGADLRGPMWRCDVKER